MKAIRAGKGKFQVVEVTCRKNGTSIVKEISEWMPIPAKALEHGIPSNKELVAGTKYEAMF